MSMWTYVNGTITVNPMGRTQEEKTYILNTVLNHLPIVSGSEENMNVYVVQKNGHDSSSSYDELGEITNNLINSYGNKSFEDGWLRVQSEYLIVVDGSLRDRYFNEVFKEFNKWLNRFSKRVMVKKILVEIKDYEKSFIIKEEFGSHYDMEEYPSWSEKGTKNWCEYLMFDREEE